MKNLSWKEKRYIKGLNLNPRNWSVLMKTSDMWLLLQNETKKTREVPAP